MKCSKCKADNKLKDRRDNDGKCSQCRQRFVFEPTSMGPVKLTDIAYEGFIDRVSASCTLKFTEKQLYYKIIKAKEKPANTVGCLVGLGVVLAFGCFSSSTGSHPGLIFLGILAGAFAAWAIWFALSKTDLKKSFPPVAATDEQTAAGWLLHWCEVRGPLPGLIIDATNSEYQKQIKSGIDQKALLLESLSRDQRPVEYPAELTQYSFDRVVVTESQVIAEFLIGNNFHFENNCAVLSIDGYPQKLFTTVMEMLRKNDQLKVFALHDARPKSLDLAHYLRTSPDWFLNQPGATVYDIGLYPRQLMKTAVTRRKDPTIVNELTRLKPEILATLTAEEIRFFEKGLYYEVEVFSPQKLLRLITVEIGKVRNSDTSIDSLSSDVLIAGSVIGSSTMPSDTFG